MRGWLIDAAVRVLSVPLVAAGLVGVAVATQDAGRASFVVGAGSLSGVLVGCTARWSREGDVRWRDVARFATAGMGVLLVMAGASSIGTGATWPAAGGLLLFWWWLSRVAREPRSVEQPWAPRIVRLPPRSRPGDETPISELSTSLLCRLWDELMDRPEPGASRHTATPVPHPAAVSMRVEVLDELERRDPEGFARWVDREAPYNPHTYVGRVDPQARP